MPVISPRPPGNVDAYLPHAELLRMRNALPPDDPRQRALALAEHEAFAREWTQEHPLIAPLSLLVATPGYEAAKALGLVHARTPASLAAIGAGYRGIGQGLGNVISGALR